MNATVWLILLGVVAVISAFGLIARIMEGAPLEWKDLAARHPARSATPPPGARSMRLYVANTLANTNRARVRPITTRFAADEDHLHLWPESIRGGAGLGVSIPWAAAVISASKQTPMGPHVTVAVDTTVLLIPESAIEEEVALRRELERHADPLVEEIG